MNFKSTFTYSLFIFSCISWSAFGESSDEEGKASRSLPLTSKKEFTQLFKQKRAAQLQAVKSLLGMSKYERKYQMVSTVLTKLFEVQATARGIVENSAYIPGYDEDDGPSIPKEAKTLEALSSIIENCALLGDIILRLPEISNKLMKDNNQWLVATQWCISFTNTTGLIDDVTMKMFNLVAQELELLPRDPEYYNPYRKAADPFSDVPSIAPKATSTVNKLRNAGQVEKKEKPKKKIQKGPRMSKSEL